MTIQILRCAGTLRAAVIAVLLTLHLPLVCYGSEFHNTPSLQGFTGLLNTPNAEVTEEGGLDALYTNQKEAMWRNRTRRQENYMFSVGFFDFAEVGGRLLEAPGLEARDLSGNFKVTLAPLTRKFQYIPDLAFGMQDVGGGVKFLQTKYIVASEEIWRFRFSVGYGNGPDRMKGLFGGAEFKAHDWVYLVAEHDTDETNVGVKLVTPQLPLIPVRLNLVAKSSLDYRPGNVDIGFGFQIPLSFERTRGEKVLPVPQSSPAEAAAVMPQEKKMPPVPAQGEPEAASLPPAISATAGASMQRVQSLLVEDGFQGVTVGSLKGTLAIEYENNRYLHNELDALGVVLGVARDVAEHDFDRVRVTIRKKGIAMVQLTATMADLNRMLAGEDTGEDTLQLSLAGDYAEPDLVATGETVSPYLKPTLILWPGLTTFVGTEVGVFDYFLSLKTELMMNTWKGGVANLRWSFPLSWSKNLDDGKRFRTSRTPSELERAMFFQAIKVSPSILGMAGAGMISHDVYGTINELIWSSDKGDHRIRLKQAFAADDTNRQTKEVYLASYRYYLDRLDLSMEVTGGRFWGEDKGFTAEMKRYFGDTDCSLYYKNTKAPSGEHWQAAGIQFTFPLTFRREMKPTIAQVRGIEDWRYAQETTIPTDRKLNDLPDIPLGINPQPSVNLETLYFNRDRLNERYLNAHLDRIRQAYKRFGIRPVVQ